MRLHTDAIAMGKMYFYDIMLLYRAYEEYVKAENEQSKAEETRYKAEYEDKVPDYKSVMSDANNFSNSFDSDSLSRGFTMPSMPSIPGF